MILDYGAGVVLLRDLRQYLLELLLILDGIDQVWPLDLIAR
jgi:hypothetical protein